MSKQQHTFLDNLVMQFDQGMQAVFGSPTGTKRKNPAAYVMENKNMTSEQRKESARLMRVNHTGEVCAQALYQGQAVTSQDVKVKELMQHSANEESDHLLWCEHRIKELGGRTSYLNPFFYTNSFLLGAFAGWCGDKWSLGFLAETEKQVEMHLDSHLRCLPQEDSKSFDIVSQMKIDEAQHASSALDAGGVELPSFIKTGMRFCAKLMTTTTYYL